MHPQTARKGDKIEIRPIYEFEDFGKEFTPELRAKEEQLRAEIQPAGTLVTADAKKGEPEGRSPR
jgi:hypothetical protein